MAVTDLLLAVAWMALYQAVKALDRNVALLGVLFQGLFIVLDLAVTWPNHAAIFVLGERYAVAGAAERAELVAAAGSAAAVMDSPVPATYAILFPSLGIFFGGLAMRRGSWHRGTVAVAVLVGVSGVAATAGPFVSEALELAPVANALLVTLWYLIVAVPLFRHGRGR